MAIESVLSREPNRGYLQVYIYDVWVSVMGCVSSCLVFKSIKQHLDMYTYKEDDDLQLLQLLILPFITATKIAGIYWVIFSCFNSVYSPILFSCWYYYYLTETTNQSAQIQN